MITSRSQVSSNKHSKYHYHITQYGKTVPIQRIAMNTENRYRYRGSVRIQKNGTDAGDQYEYKKSVSIQRIGVNTKKQYSFGKQFKYRFQTLHYRQDKHNS